MKKIKFFIGLLGYWVTGLLLPAPVLADAPGCTYLNGDIPSLGCLADVIVNIINLLFAFLGTVTVLIIIFGAIKFVVSSGDPKAIETAKKTITYAIIGAIVVLLAFLIINAFYTILGLPSPLSNFSLFVSP